MCSFYRLIPLFELVVLHRFIAADAIAPISTPLLVGDALPDSRPESCRALPRGLPRRSPAAAAAEDDCTFTGPEPDGDDDEDDGFAVAASDDDGGFRKLPVVLFKVGCGLAVCLDASLALGIAVIWCRS